SRDPAIRDPVNRDPAPLPAPDEIHDLDLITVPDRRRFVARSLDDREVVLDGDEPRVDVQLFEQLQDGQFSRQLDRIAVDANSHMLLQGTGTPTDASSRVVSP